MVLLFMPFLKLSEKCMCEKILLGKQFFFVHVRLFQAVFFWFFEIFMLSNRLSRNKVIFFTLIAFLVIKGNFTLIGRFFNEFKVLRLFGHFWTIIVFIAFTCCLI